MTCKRDEIISDEEENNSLFHNVVFLPLLVLYLCVPIVSLIKYIYADILKIFRSKQDLKRGQDTEEIVKLKVENTLLKEEIQKGKYAKDMVSVLKSYEYTLKRFVEDHKNIVAERDALQEVLHILEENYHDLTLKYDKAKEVIDGLEKNGETLRRHLYRWEEVVDIIEQKYVSFKEFALGKIDQANDRIKSIDSEYKHEISILKSKALESQMEMKELETKISNLFLRRAKCKLPDCMLAPLVTNIN